MSRRRRVVDRENALSDIMDVFYNLSPKEKIASVIETAYNIGSLGKMKINNIFQS